MQVSLAKAGAVFQCHPRTILRAMSGASNPYWSESHNPNIEVSALAEAFHCNVEMLEAVFHGDDKILKPHDAAKKMKTSDRNLRYRAIEAFIRRRGIVRYLQTTIELAESGVI